MTTMSNYYNVQQQKLFTPGNFIKKKCKSTPYKELMRANC